MYAELTPKYASAVGMFASTADGLGMADRRRQGRDAAGGADRRPQAHELGPLRLVEGESLPSAELRSKEYDELKDGPASEDKQRRMEWRLRAKAAIDMATTAIAMAIGPPAAADVAFLEAMLCQDDYHPREQARLALELLSAFESSAVPVSVVPDEPDCAVKRKAEGGPADASSSDDEFGIAAVEPTRLKRLRLGGSDEAYAALTVQWPSTVAMFASTAFIDLSALTDAVAPAQKDSWPSAAAGGSAPPDALAASARPPSTKRTGPPSAAPTGKRSKLVPPSPDRVTCAGHILACVESAGAVPVPPRPYFSTSRHGASPVPHSLCPSRAGVYPITVCPVPLRHDRTATTHRPV